MKAITVCQPYAELIARGDKRVENRSLLTRHRGPVAIHAGNSRLWLARARAAGHWCGNDEGLIFGAVIAVAELVDCLAYARTEDGDWPPGFNHSRWLLDDRHASGPWCWVLQDVRRLNEPIPCAGRQRLWDLRAEIADRLREDAAVGRP
jgi:hypothetical protein